MTDQTDHQTDRQPDHQTDHQADHQTDRQPDQLYVCSNCHKYEPETFNSQLMSDDGGQVMDAVITDVDDIVSASQDNVSSPR